MSSSDNDQTRTQSPSEHVAPGGALIAHYDLEKEQIVHVSGTEDAPRALLLIRQQGRNLDLLDVSPASEVGIAIKRWEASSSAPERAQRQWKKGGGHTLSASVILCTTGQSDLLLPAVRAILAQEHPNFELIVVDNAPSSGLTR
ncbi:MAG: hypothetical protein CSA82_00685, partial [Actinobacteria bacterium]